MSKLGGLLIEKAKLLSSVKKQVQSLQRELAWMKSFLTDLESVQEEGNERLRTRITEIRRIAYDTEDVIDSFILEASAEKTERFLKSYACFFNSLAHTHETASQIEAIRTRIQESTEMLHKYQVGVKTEDVQRRRLGRSYPYGNDDCVIGLEEDIKSLVEHLTNITNEENIVCVAWVSLSQEWNAPYFLFEILRQVRDEKRKSDEIWSMEELVEKLQDHLQQNLYLIVLDDVWGKEALEEMLPAVPNGEGRKIIVTTHNHEISWYPDLRCLVHEPRRLTEVEAWELFSTIALNHRHNIDHHQHFVNFEKLGTRRAKEEDFLEVISSGSSFPVNKSAHDDEGSTTQARRTIIHSYSGTTIKGLQLHFLRNLQTLWGVRGGSWMLKDMLTLSTVERMAIGYILSKDQLEAVFQSACLNSDNLHSLYLGWNFGEAAERQNLEMISHSKRMHKLGLTGRIADKFAPFLFPSNIMKLRLLHSELGSQETMAALWKLHNLKCLNLQEYLYMGTEWTCSAGEFPQLEQLHLFDLQILEEWRVERGAMPLLKKLVIWKCKALKRLPEGLQFIVTLHELVIQAMPQAFQSRVQQADENGERTGPRRRKSPHNSTDPNCDN
ncbi:hypothetical protein Ancab_010123 [Ancistrocladus abbreviatus]